jgi:hypothetical protein
MGLTIKSGKARGGLLPIWQSQSTGCYRFWVSKLIRAFRPEPRRGVVAYRPVVPAVRTGGRGGPAQGQPGTSPMRS